MTEDGQKLDGELVRSILSGEENAFDTLYHRHKSRLYGFIANRINDRRDVEELVNNTFLKARRHLHTLQEPEKVLNWMYGIANQLIAGWHRNNRKRVRIQSLSGVSEVEVEAASVIVHRTTEEYSLNEERRKQLLEAIGQLPELEQRMIYLQLENKKYEEIADICKVSVSSVRNRLSQAKKQLKIWATAWEAANAEGGDLDFLEFNNEKGKL